MLNRFYTILVIPEKTSKVRKFVMPSWMFRGAAVGLGFTLLLGGVMVVDYWYVMSQIGENKELKMENRRLKQQVQIFKNKLTTVENTMSRIKTFSTRLKVITNIEDRGGGLLQSLNNNKLPDASTNTGESAEAKFKADVSSNDEQTDTNSPSDQRLRKDSEELDRFFSHINHESLYLEQVLQDQYELLVDQKDFLLATPTRKPSPGYVTSGFGIRKSPYGGRVKMHEGLDIANYPGTPIKAPANGVVVYADSKPGYGQTVILDHGYGLETWYGHARKLLVNKGQKIKRGDSIAQVGSSGRSTGPHVHYEVRINGIPVNPLSYFLEN